MLNGRKLKDCREQAGMTVDAVARALMSTVKPELKAIEFKRCLANVKNWEKGLYKPRPKTEDVNKLASILKVSAESLQVWTASHKFCPMTPRKVRLVADLIRDRNVQDALDLLKFTNKRAAVYVRQVLQSAIANADEQDVDITNLYVSESRVDGAGIRRGTRRWRPKDRGRAVSFTRLASHVYVSVDLDN